MADYRAPVTDALFALRHIGMLDELSKTERYAHADPETVARLTPAFETARDAATRWVEQLAQRVPQS